MTTQWRYSDPQQTVAFREFDDGSFQSCSAILVPLDEPILPYVSPSTDAELIAQNVERLWRVAHELEARYVTGIAIGLLTVGVMQSKPKALAVQAWIKSIWTVYYTRKAALTPIMDEALLDFSSLGAPPYSMPELQAELGL